jgi:hypothetical protein
METNGQRYVVRPMSKDERLLSLQANAICVLLFLIGMAALVEHPAWFR